VPPLVKILGAFPAKPSKRPTTKSTLTVASKTMREAEATWLQLLFSSVSFTPRGVYGGKLVNTKTGDGFILTKYAIAPGVFLTGKVMFVALGPPSTYKGTVKVSGPAAATGTLKFSKNSVSGKLGGRSVKASY
jgi:hypothetical protein